MKKHSPGRIILILLAILAFSDCENSQGQSEKIKNISVEEAYKMMTENPQIVVIDVRTPGEYTGSLGHVAGSELKPVQLIENWVSEIDSLKDKEIILICRSGNRSGRAASYLSEHGFKKLINVKGGMLDWNSKGLPVEKHRVKE